LNGLVVIKNCQNARRVLDLHERTLTPWAKQRNLLMGKKLLLRW
jgi:hypothetical protein